MMCKTTTSAHDFEGLFEYAKCINICLGFGKMTIQGGPTPTKRATRYNDIEFGAWK